MSIFIRSLLGAAIISAVAMTAALPAHANTAPFEGVVLVPPAAQKAESTGFKRGTIVDYATTLAAGSIVVVTKQHVLYFVLGNGKAVKYPVATGKKGFEWKGTHTVSAKVQWPSWRPPADMRKRRPELPTFMAGGPKNPLGARAIYLGSSIYRIHGTNEPSSIGKSASSGCIRMQNSDVIELYSHVKAGTTVVVS
jgi:lipoprotein-anchoring transpeptidase ErfK/SrfK